MGRWFEVYAFRLGESESHTVALLFTDITERRIAEKSISESNERFRNLADDINLAYLVGYKSELTQVSVQLHF